MKAFLILCILLATVLFSPYSTTAQHLADDSHKDVGVTTPIGGRGRPTQPIIKCPPGQSYQAGRGLCVPGKPKPSPKCKNPSCYGTNP